MSEQTERERPARYPWARALMILVLYGALLVFLWHFPTPGGREFFQNLFQGFLYVLAGGALVVITLVFLFFFPLPEVAPPEAAEDVWEEGVEMALGGVVMAHALFVPAFREPTTEPQVWEILYGLEEDLQPQCDIAADPYTGVITITDLDDDEARLLIKELRLQLKEAGFSARIPR